MVPRVFSVRLTNETYLEYLQQTLPCLLEDVPLATCKVAWFVHDGASALSSHTVNEYLVETFNGRFITNGGTIAWPARSPELNPLDFFLWGFTWSLVYATPVDSKEYLLTRIQNCSKDIFNTPCVFSRVRQSMVCRCKVCIEQGGSHFEHLS